MKNVLILTMEIDYRRQISQLSSQTENHILRADGLLVLLKLEQPEMPVDSYLMDYILLYLTY